jgi:hypothetical protein
MENRRYHVRRRTLKGGRLTYDDNTRSAECLIRDLSDIGARVQVADVRSIPSDLTLSFDDGKASRRGFVKWRRGAMLGIAFTDEKVNRHQAPARAGRAAM